jgi:hypothetical protein
MMKNKIFKSLLLALACILSFSACSDDEPVINTTPIIKSVTTTEAEVTAYSAVLKGTVDGLSGMASSSYRVGALYSESENPQADGVDVTGSFSDGNISASVEGLQTNKVYYYCVYVTLQGRVSYYGEVKSFVTTDAKLAASASSSVTASKATITASVSGIDGVPVEVGAGAKISTSSDLEAIKDGLNVDGKVDGGALSVEAAGLLPNTTYYYVPYISLGDGHVYGEAGQFTTGNYTAQYVDLGLSVLWATANIGAEKASDLGSLVAYGELDVTKHSTDIADYTVNGDVFGGSHDIAAALDYGRLPMADEVKELLLCTTHEWATVEGVQGIRFTADNGNSIFLPAAGSRSGQTVANAASVGNYWLGQVDGTNNEFGRILQFSSSSAGLETLARNVAASARPVKKQPVEFKKALLNQTWYIDLDADGKSYLWDGPMYFYGSDDSWTTISDGDVITGDSWCWAPAWGDISSWIGFAPQEFGSMTFNEDGTVTVEDKANGKSFSGTYTINEKDRTVTLKNAEVLHVPGDYSNVATNLRILSLTDQKLQIAIIRSDGQALSQNYISGEQKSFYSKPACTVSFCDWDGQNGWPTTKEQVNLAPGETHTIAINEPMVAGSVVILDFEGLRSEYPHAFIKLDKIELDGKAVNFDANKLKYGDLENNGNYRIEIFNRWGSGTANDSPFGGTDPDSEAALACNSKIELTYTVVNLKDNSDDNLLVAELTTCDTDWNCGWPDAKAPLYFNGGISDTQQSVVVNGSRANGMIELVELKNVMATYPNIQLRLDEVLVDGVSVPFDANKILYGDLEGSGNYRIELFNTYGSTGAGLPDSCPWASYDTNAQKTSSWVPALGFNSSFEVKYTVLKLF